MSTIVWPAPSATTDLTGDVAATTARELEWLLVALQDTLAALKDGLTACAELLAPQEPGSTLVLSSHRSESLKGFVTRVGTRIVKGDIQLRIPPLLPIPRGQTAFRIALSTAPTAPAIVLSQLTAARTLINGSLDVIDATRWTGDSHNANFIAGQLQLLHEHILEAKGALQGSNGNASTIQPWNVDPLDPSAFQPSLPRNLVLHLSIADAAIVLTVRTLEPADSHTGTNTPTGVPPASSYTGFSLRERLATALGTGAPSRAGTHDEADRTFMLRGQEVTVRDKVRVESQDPSLIAALAKLGALERSVAGSRRALDVVMGRETDGD